MMLSVIIPTRNRADYLDSVLSSVFSQTLSEENYEVIVIDNGSTDTTREMTSRYMGQHSNLQYHYAASPGLHVGRHLGAKLARGAILVYCDDDIIASPGWLKSIQNAFKDETVAIVGGKILPRWDGEVPDWIEQFRTSTEQGWYLGCLSLLDFGNRFMDIDPFYVFGCNYSIRKGTLYSCGGFHPDAMPQDLIRYRGDGETGLSRKITEKKLRTVYVPEAMVYHRVPVERLTVEYFCRRAFNQGISDSYTEIRRKGGISPLSSSKKNIRDVLHAVEMKFSLISFLAKKLLSKAAEESYDIALKYRVAYSRGYEFHRKEVLGDPELLNHVLRETYF